MMLKSCIFLSHNKLNRKDKPWAAYFRSKSRRGASSYCRKDLCSIRMYFRGVLFKVAQIYELFTSKYIEKNIKKINSTEITNQ